MLPFIVLCNQNRIIMLVHWCKIFIYAMTRRLWWNYIYIFLVKWFESIYVSFLKKMEYKSNVGAKWELIVFCPSDLSTLPRVQGKAVFLTELKKYKIFRKWWITEIRQISRWCGRHRFIQCNLHNQNRVDSFWGNYVKVEPCHFTLVYPTVDVK